MAAKKKASAKAEKTNVNEAPAVEESQVAPQPPAGDEGPQLTIADLQTLAQAIDMASRRGAYGAAEMGDVGAVYNKLTAFLQLIADQQREASQKAGQ